MNEKLEEMVMHNFAENIHIWDKQQFTDKEKEDIGSRMARYWLEWGLKDTKNWKAWLELL